MKYENDFVVLDDPRRHLSSTSQSFSLREFLIILFKDKKQILTGFLLPMALFAIASFWVVPRYEAVATVMVRMGREYLYRPEVGESNLPPVAADREQTLHSEVAIINSRDQLEKVIQAMGVERIYPALAAKAELAKPLITARALMELERRLDVLLLKDSNIIKISFQHPNPEISAEIINRLIDSYLVKRREIFSSNRVSFAEEQVKATGNKLASLETQIEQFKRNNKIASYSQQLALLLGQRDSLEVRLAQVQENLAGTGQRVAATRSNLGTLTGNVARYSENTIDLANANLVELRNKQREAASKFNENSPIMVDLKASIRAAERQVQELETSKTSSVRLGRNAARDELEITVGRLGAEQKALEATRVQLVDQLRSINEDVSRFSQKQSELESLLRERQLLDASYQSSVRKLQEAKSNEELDRSAKASVSIVQSALAPTEPKSVRLVILMIGLVVSTCFALLVAFLSELLRTTFISPEKVERTLGLPVLAAFPKRGDVAKAAITP